MEERNGIWYDDPIHGWFELSYSNYLVLNRSVMQSMPHEWQDRMVALLREATDRTRNLEFPYTYAVSPKNSDGRFVKDPIPHYNRGRARVELAPPSPPLEELIAESFEKFPNEGKESPGP